MEAKAGMGEGASCWEGGPWEWAPGEGAGAVTRGRAAAKQQAEMVGVWGEAKAEAESKQ